MRIIIRADSQHVAVLAVRAAFEMGADGNDLQAVRFSDGSVFGMRRNKDSISVWPESLPVAAE